MKILLINGSPKGKRSNSLKLAYSFIEGFKNGCTDDEESISIDELHVASMNIAACKGCFACWQKTPGICCIKDDMQKVIGKLIDADLILWSFPLYYFNVPGILKNLIDRQLPMSLPFMSSKQNGYGSGSHDSRYDMEGKRHVLISTCGFYSAVGNYDSVLRMFDHFLGKGNYTTIFCGQGELFRVKELSARTDEYLSTVKCAGSEYAMTGTISEETEAILHTLLYPRDVFEKMADASWGISKTTGEKEPDDLVFTRQMAALYNKDQLSMAAVAILSAAANITGNGVLPTNIGYLVFGLFWLLSCLTKEPLCAAYVKYNYGGENAHQNPLFMKTNYILAAAWGTLYVLTAIWTFLFKKAGFGNVLILVNNLIPILMGLFTAWFEKWYPARMARGKRK